MVFYAGFWLIFIFFHVLVRNVPLSMIFSVYKCLCVAAEDHCKSHTKSYDIAMVLQ